MNPHHFSQRLASKSNDQWRRLDGLFKKVAHVTRTQGAISENGQEVGISPYSNGRDDSERTCVKNWKNKSTQSDKIPLVSDVPTFSKIVSIFHSCHICPCFMNLPVTIAPNTLPKATPTIVSKRVTGAEHRLDMNRKYTKRNRIPTEPAAEGHNDSAICSSL